MKKILAILVVSLVVIANAFIVSVAQDAKKPAQQPVTINKSDVQVLLYLAATAQFSGTETKFVAPVIAKLDSVAADTSRQAKPIALTAVEQHILNAVIDRSELKRKLNGGK